MTEAPDIKRAVQLVADTGRDYRRVPRYEPWMDQLQRGGDPAPVRAKRTFPAIPTGCASILAFPGSEIGGAA